MLDVKDRAKSSKLIPIVFRSTSFQKSIALSPNTDVLSSLSTSCLCFDLRYTYDLKLHKSGFLFRTKPVPSRSTVLSGISFSIEHINFPHPKHNYQYGEHARINTTMDELEKKVQLSKGIWRKRQ